MIEALIGIASRMIVVIIRYLPLPDAWKTYLFTPGQIPARTSQRELNRIYGVWIIALVLKLLGSTWDVAWHYHFLRDDLAPPHNINTVGTIIVVLLVMFHTWTGKGVDKRSLRWMQVGIGAFLMAIPLDIINHRLFGLDITAWSPTHMLLYVGTAIMLVGVLMGWKIFAQPGRLKLAMSLGFWTLLLEDILFTLGQHEYGVLSRYAIAIGKPTAGAELLQFAYQQGNGDPSKFVLPVPMWVYPAWLIPMSVLVLVAARMTTGWRWSGTAVATIYVLYRTVAYFVLQAMGFPPSAVPILIVLIGAGVLVDSAINWRWSMWVATPLLIAWFYSAASLISMWNIVPVVPDFSFYTIPWATVTLLSIWYGVQWLSTQPLLQRLRTAHL